MKESLAIASAFAGASLLAGCNAEQTPPPQELVVAHRTKFAESEDPELATNVRLTPLDIGTRVTAICVLYTHDEITPEPDTGFIRVKWNDRVGAVRTFEKPKPGEIVDTFEDMTESELVDAYGRCPDSPK